MRTAKNISFTIVISAVFVLVTAFCISGTVISQSKHADRIEARYYREMEQNYVKEVRSLLAEQGYVNSGVTMTGVIYEDGQRDYTVILHHKGFNKLNITEKQALLKECEKIVFPVETCKFFHEFMEEDC